MAIHALDPIERAGLTHYVQQDDRLFEANNNGVDANDVSVVSVDTTEAFSFDLLRDLQGASPTKFLLIVKNEWTFDVSTVMTYGVRGALPYTDCSPTVFSQALLTIDAGGEEFSWPLVGTLLPEIRSGSGLTDREIFVLRLAAEGWTHSEIAKKMFCSKESVKATLHDLMEHLNLRNRAHAVSYAIRSGAIR